MEISKLIQDQFQTISRLILILMLFLTGCSSATESNSDEDFGECEPGPYFTHLPVDQEQINYFLVLGKLSPPGDVFPRGQTGIQLKRTGLTPVYAVGDVEIRFIERSRWLSSAFREGHSDYSISFEIPDCRAIYGNYEHMDILDESLEAYLADAECEIYSTESETIESCGTRVELPVSAGTVIGQAGGFFTGLDFDLFDRRVYFDFVEVDRYPMARWAICPQYLFIDPLRDILLDKTGRFETRRTAEPRCGTMEIDIAGTAQGMWVLDGHDVTLTAQHYDKFFALAPHEIEPEKYLVLVTAHSSFRMSGNYHLFRFELEESGRVNRRFSELESDETVYCYESEAFHHNVVSFLMAYGADDKITIERVDHEPGSSPCAESAESWIFSESAIKLMR